MAINAGMFLRKALLPVSVAALGLALLFVAIAVIWKFCETLFGPGKSENS